MPINLTDPINLQLKDPTSPLVSQIPIPACPTEMPFMVFGWDGSGKDIDTWAGRAAACYYVMASSIPEAISKIGRPIAWQATQNLIVQTGAGFAINANYDRLHLNFFLSWDAIRQKMVFATGAIDVMAHELGHAFLDSLRPDFWNFAIPEIGAFHESFADIHGFTTVMRQDKILVNALIETGGDLKQSNIISQIGTEMGTCFYQMPIGQIKPLRDASIPFRYQDSTLLPASAPADQLSTEAHSLSRVFTSAIYAIMIGIYLKKVSQGVDGLDALRQAGQQVMTYIFQAVQVVPSGRTMFQNMANAFSLVDHNAGSPYAEIIASVFSQWNLSLPNSLSSLSSESKVHTTKTIKKSETKKFNDLGLVQSYSPLHDVSFHVPLDEYRRFDEQGNIVEEYIPNKNETYQSIIKFADHLLLTDRVGDDKEFRVLDGTLIRNHTNCCQGA